MGAAGYGGEGNRSEAKAEAAITELRMVRGSWPRDAVVVAFKKSSPDGCSIGMSVTAEVGVLWVGDRIDRRRPTEKMIRVYGKLG